MDLGRVGKTLQDALLSPAAKATPACVCLHFLVIAAGREQLGDTQGLAQCHCKAIVVTVLLSRSGSNRCLSWKAGNGFDSDRA